VRGAAQPPRRLLSPAELADRLARVELVIFDKDGTLIDFDSMWAGWIVGLADALERHVGRALRDELYLALGFDAEAGHAVAGGPLAATPMGELRLLTVDAVRRFAGVGPVAAEEAVRVAWHPPDPVALAAPLADLPALFGAIHARGARVAVATSDDRAPTMATLEALGALALVDAHACADDGIPVKPAPGMVLAVCAELGVTPGRAAVVGDAPADLEMARAAGSGLVVGVLSGVGSVDDLGPLADALIPSIASLAVLLGAVVSG
jgi:phosphoglycolate phosphatase-like HAD superfamily hydrolase